MYIYSTQLLKPGACGELQIGEILGDQSSDAEDESFSLFSLSSFFFSLDIWMAATMGIGGVLP